MTQSDFMKTKPLIPLLTSMSLPMMFSMLILSLYNIVDSIYVAKLGQSALTAVSIAFPLQNTIGAVGVGVGVGITSTISIYLGANQPKKANITATLGILLSIFHCIMFIVIGLFLTKYFLQLFTKDSIVLEQAIEYSQIVLCFSFGTIIQVAMEKIFQAVGAMKETMYLLAIGCIINIILDPILIFGYFGFPPMGVRGAAIATVAGQIIGFFCYILVYIKKSFSVKIHPSYLVWDFHIIKQIYSVGIPSSLMMILPSILTSIFNKILFQFSDIYVAVLGIYLKLQTFIYMPVNGMIQGIRPILGYNYGAKEYKRMTLTIRYSLIAIGFFMTIGTVISFFFAQPIMLLFSTKQEVLTIGIIALQITGFSYIFSTYGIVYSGTFEAIGNGKLSLSISLLRQFFIPILLSLLLVPFLGAIGIWISFPISEFCASIFSIFLFQHEKKKFQT